MNLQCGSGAALRSGFRPLFQELAYSNKSDFFRRGRWILTDQPQAPVYDISMVPSEDSRFGRETDSERLTLSQAQQAVQAADKFKAQLQVQQSLLDRERESVRQLQRRHTRAQQARSESTKAGQELNQSQKEVAERQRVDLQEASKQVEIERKLLKELQSQAMQQSHWMTQETKRTARAEEVLQKVQEERRALAEERKQLELERADIVRAKQATDDEKHRARAEHAECVRESLEAIQLQRLQLEKAGSAQIDALRARIVAEKSRSPGCRRM